MSRDRVRIHVVPDRPRRCRAAPTRAIGEADLAPDRLLPRASRRSRTEPRDPIGLGEVEARITLS